jgi:chemotaxis protein MotA|tara:strand:+ start:1867 stop:2655 length:789 start_codon:yes stop_codon:yes gene_type:complete
LDLATILGLLSGIFLIGTGMYGGSIENAVPITNFWSLNSIFIVLGGTIAATAVAFPMKEVLRILGLISMVFKKPRYILPQIIEDVVKISEECRAGEGQLVKKIDKIKNFFLKDGIQFIIDDLKIDEIVELMEKREFYRNEREIQEANLMNKMGVFAPAFGLVGTLIGLVFMLFAMGNQEAGTSAATSLGSAMGIALITTFYGAVLANLIFIPFSEKIKSRNSASSLESAIIIEGIKMIYEKKHPIIVREHLNSYLPPRERTK